MFAFGIFMGGLFREDHQSCGCMVGRHIHEMCCVSYEPISAELFGLWGSIDCGGVRFDSNFVLNRFYLC